MPRLNWGIIGASDIARSRAAVALRELPSCRLLSILSRDVGRAKQFASQHGAERAYDRLADFLSDPDLDAVYVASEVYRHCGETLAAAEAGKHVLCEKPMALTSDECAQMVGACERAGVNLAIAYYRRYYPKTVKMKELIEAGAIGRPTAARAALSSNFLPASDDPKRWRVVPERSGGGPLADVGSHYLDLMCHLLGPPADVQASMDRLVHPYAVADTETCLVRFRTGVHLTAHFAWNLPGTLNSFEVHGTKGALFAAPFDGPRLILNSPAGEESFEVPRPANTHTPLFADFTARVLSSQPPRFDGRQGSVATAIIQGGYESNECGRRVGVAAI